MIQCGTSILESNLIEKFDETVTRCFRVEHLGLMSEVLLVTRKCYGNMLMRVCEI